MADIPLKKLKIRKKIKFLFEKMILAEKTKRAELTPMRMFVWVSRCCTIAREPARISVIRAITLSLPTHASFLLSERGDSSIVLL